MKKIITAITAIILVFGVSKETFGQTIYDTICQGSSVTYWGNTYSQTGTYTNGPQTLNLTVNPLPTPTISFAGSVCDGNNLNDTVFIQFSDTPSTITILNGSATLYSGAYSSISYYSGSVFPGIYTLIATSQLGCTDSGHLSINACDTNFMNHSICQGDSFLFHGQNYGSAGTYSHLVTADSIDVLVLSIDAAPQLYAYANYGDSLSCNYNNDSLFATIYNSVSAQILWKYNGNTVGSGYVHHPATPGTYTAIAYGLCGNDTAIVTALPCDSGTNYIYESVCQGDSFLFHGHNYGSAGAYVYQVATDTFDVLYLSIISPTALSVYRDSSSCIYYASAYAVWQFNGNIVDSGYQYLPTDTGVHTAIAYGSCGNDTVIFSVQPCTRTITTYQSICQGDSLFFDNHWIYSAGTYQHTFINNGETDSVQILHVSLNTPPDINNIYQYGTCLGDSFFLYVNVVGNNASQIVWQFNGNTVATNYTVQPTAAGTYTVIVSNSCGSDTSAYTVSQGCLSDSIWPGDANHDGIVDNYDMLPIGIATGLGGPARATTSIVWQGYSCTDWGLQLLNGVNAKHIDCDGNGIINTTDADVINQNFNLTHNKNEEEHKPERAGIAGLRIVILNDTFHSGDMLTASLQLGTENEPVNNIYGLAFTYNFDKTVIDTASVSFEYTNSWLATDSQRIDLAKGFNDIGKIKTAITRFDHVNRSGSGEIAIFRGIITTDNINGKDWSYYTTSHFISGLEAVDKDGNLIELNEGIDTAKIAYEISGIARVNNEISFSLYPNPAQNTLTVKGTENIEGVIIHNVLGSQIYAVSNSNRKEQTIDVSSLPNGVYIAQITTANGIGSKRFVVAK